VDWGEETRLKKTDEKTEPFFILFSTELGRLRRYVTVRPLKKTILFESSSILIFGY